jgi:hypothetical protein
LNFVDPPEIFAGRLEDRKDRSVEELREIKDGIVRAFETRRAAAWESLLQSAQGPLLSELTRHLKSGDFSDAVLMVTDVSLKTSVRRGLQHVVDEAMLKYALRGVEERKLDGFSDPDPFDVTLHSTVSPSSCRMIREAMQSPFADVVLDLARQGHFDEAWNQISAYGYSAKGKHLLDAVLDAPLFATRNPVLIKQFSSGLFMRTRMQASLRLGAKLANGASDSRANEGPTNTPEFFDIGGKSGAVPGETTMAQDPSRAADEFRWRRLVNAVPDGHRAYFQELSELRGRDDIYAVADVIRRTHDVHAALTLAKERGVPNPQKLIYGLNVSLNDRGLDGGPFPE